MRSLQCLKRQRARTDKTVHVLVVLQEAERLERVGARGATTAGVRIDGEVSLCIQRLQIEEAWREREVVQRTDIGVVVVRHGAIGAVARDAEIELGGQAARHRVIDVDARVVTQCIGVDRNAAFELTTHRGQVARATISRSTAHRKGGVVTEARLAEQVVDMIVERNCVAVGRIDAAEDGLAAGRAGGRQC